MFSKAYLIWIAISITSFVAGFVARRIVSEKKVKLAEQKAKEIVEEATKTAVNKKKEVDLEARDLLYKLRTDFERETKDRRQEMSALEKRLIQKEENIDRKVDLLDRKERDINQRERALTTKENELASQKAQLDKMITEEKQLLQRISGLSQEEAKKLFLDRIEQELKIEAAGLIKRIEDEARETADKKAKEIISLSIQRCAAEHTTESTVSVVNLPSDDMKGRIIGREGRNIRALEIATGVDVIVDDTPEAVTLSGFDPIRREIARISLERLITDGRIHPGRIEEIVEKVKEEMDAKIREEGERAAFDVGVHGLHVELVKLLGRLKYRTSYGQNVLQHSKEVSYIMGVMASEFGLDFKLARRIGLLHDIGKAVSHEIEGTHAKIGADLLKKYGESEQVIDAALAHHEEVAPKSIYSVLCQAADAISAARPGARRETLETYVKRLEKLESIADSFNGVERAFAIQAGREVRVIVQPEKISDEQAIVLARDLTKKIEEGLEYPGQIKVTVIRETRAIEYAK